MNRKAFVLLSGGVDSTTCLYLARRDYPNVEAISIDYGQRHVREAEQAKQICERLNIRHTIIKLPNILSGEGVMLTDPNVKVPDIDYSEIKGVSPTYVPFRNGTMLSVIAAHAQKYVTEQIEEAVAEDIHTELRSTDFWREYRTKEAKDLCGIYFGAHAEDAHNWAYPDCTPEFVGAMANAIYTGTYFAVRLHTPFVHSSKADIIRSGHRLGVPYELTWSCYKGEALHCGTCPTCRARKQAFEAAEVTDPTVYADQPPHNEDF